MSYIKLPSNFFSDPRVTTVSAKAVRLWVTAACWCASRGPGTAPFECGEVPAVALAELPGIPAKAARRAAAELCRDVVRWAPPLWAPTGDGWRFNNWERPVVDAGLTRRFRSSRPRILARDGGACRYCGAPAATVDHITPRCQGGPDEDANLAAACWRCNTRKGGRTPEQAGMVLQ